MRNSASVFAITAALTVGMSAAALAQSGGPYGGPGYRGNQGYQGSQGYQGYQNNPGYQGNQGFQGNQGYQGGPYGNGPMAQGGPLYQGGPGYQGYQGPGPQGYGAPQGPAQQYGGGQFGYNPQFGNQGDQQQGSWDNQAAGQSRTSQRANLRQQLRQAGFQNIRILDTTYLVRARTPSGNEVLMVLNPSGNASQSSGSGSSASNQTSGGQGGQRFGSNQGGSSGNDQSAQSQPGHNEANASNQDQTGQNQGTSGQARRLMSENQIESVLTSRGFSDISDLKRDNNVYTGTATWYGDQVDLKIDARNGFIIDPSHMTEDQMGEMLKDNGWNNVRNVQLKGTVYQVDASQDGTRYHLWIDARTGEITRQTASNESGGSPGSLSQESGTTGTVAPNGSGSPSSDTDSDGGDSGG